jgi:hypothetical protein
MTTPTPPFVTWQSLNAYAWLQTPMWVFDLEALRMRWANQAALQLWQAESVEQLGERDFSDATPSSRARLAAIMESLRRGESVGMAWTIYPEDEPVTLVINRTGILLPDGRLAILSEARPLGTDALPATVQRDLEALNQTDSQISSHPLDGTAVMRNPAAAVAFGPVNENASLNRPRHPVGGAETADLLRTSIAAHKMGAPRACAADRAPGRTLA